MNFTLVPDKESREACTNYELCAECKGFGCCQCCGCALAPSDIPMLQRDDFSKESKVRYIIRLLKKGELSIDHWRLKNKRIGAFDITLDGITLSKEKLLNGQGALYLRARNLGKGVVDVLHYSPEPEGPCVNWSLEKGCKFSFRNRPKGGRMLIPDPKGESCYNCKAIYDEKCAAEEWIPYQDILFEVYCYFKSE